MWLICLYSFMYVRTGSMSTCVHAFCRIRWRTSCLYTCIHAYVYRFHRHSRHHILGKKIVAKCRQFTKENADLQQQVCINSILYFILFDHNYSKQIATGKVAQLTMAINVLKEQNAKLEFQRQSGLNYRLLVIYFISYRVERSQGHTVANGRGGRGVSK